MTSRPHPAAIDARFAAWQRRGSDAHALPDQGRELAVRASDPAGLVTVAVDHTGIITDSAFTDRARGQTAEGLRHAIISAMNQARARLPKLCTAE